MSEMINAIDPVAHNITGRFDLITPNRTTGWAAIPAKPKLNLVVQIYIGPYFLCETRADKKRPDLEPLYGKNCNHGFEEVIEIPSGMDPSLLRFIVEGCDGEIRCYADWTPTKILIDSIDEKGIHGWA